MCWPAGPGGQNASRRTYQIVAASGASGRIEAVRVAMLGPLEVRTDGDQGEVVEVGGVRLRALLIMLALRPGQFVPASQLIDGLWAEAAPAGAPNALQALVSRLRRALPEAAIESRSAGYQLELDPLATDVVRFEQLAAAGRARLREDPAAAAAALREALGLWRGPALVDVAETDFGRAAIARLDELRLATLEYRIDADLRTGGPGLVTALVAELEGLVIAYPMREPLAGLLMRALNASGRRAAALEVYEQTRQRLVEQLGVEPSAELAALHLEILRADEPAAPAQRPARPRWPTAPDGARPASPRPPARSTNLRAELTSFVGRDAELAQVAELLRAHRLLTLTGPGGAGKTRLAAEAARAELDAMPDGVWLVELAPVTDPAEVTSAVLGALGLREQALLYAGRATATIPARAAAEQEQADALGRLLTALARQQALLVLDNCEHLVAAAATLADRVLAACPHVRIMATSREPLNITGEALWTVGPLGLPPDPAATPSFYAERAGVALSPPSAPAAGPAGHGESARIDDFASVRLLAQRARAVRPGFEVTEGNAAAVARICRALDGMPLAIELAAARLRTMAPEQVAARLGDRFQLLTGGGRTAVPRHQTLRAVVDWSWDLLEADERAVWRRFSVFTGGATLEAAEQVCSGSGIRADQVLDLLTALADKSLLTVRHDPPRYRMLEIIRAYGLERLAEAGERDELRQAHAQYFLRLADRSQEYLRGGQQLDWLNRLSDDQDNLHAAIRGAVKAGDADTAVGLVGALGWYWWLRSLKAEGAELAAEALALVPGGATPRDPPEYGGAPRPPVPPGEPLALAYTVGALLAGDTRRSESSVEWFRIATELAARVPGPDNPLLRLVGPISEMFASVFDERPPSPEAFDEAVDDGDAWVSATARILRGHLTLNSGRRHAQAEADFLRAAETFGALGERWGQSAALGGLGMLEGWRGEHAAAADHYRRAAGLAAELGSVEDETQCRLWLARELWLLREKDQARDELARALRDAERLGLPEVGDLARLDGEPDVARAELLRAMELSTAVNVALQIRAMAATGLGYLAGAEGDLDAARRWHAEALDAARSSADAPVIAQTLVGLADLALREGDPAWSATLLGASAAVRGTTDRSVPDEARVAGDARAALGDASFDEAYQRGQYVTVDTLAALISPTPGA
jgi:predicted ATPase/DNA-binding SARP family transcriptional activator